MKKYRIYLAIGGKATPGDNNNMWVKNLHDPLVAMGHEVHLLNTDEYAEQKGLGYMSKEAKEELSSHLPVLFLKEHTRKPFDIFFSYFHNGQIIPEVLKEIRKHVYTVNYSTNYHQFDMYKEVAKIVDCNIYISKIAKQGFDNLGVKSYWMPLAANSAFYKPSKEKNEDVVFIGSEYGPRSYFFWRLLQYGINLQLYGHGWKESENEEMLTIVENDQNNSNSKSILNKLLRSATGYEIRKKQVKEKPLSLEEQLRNQYKKQNKVVLSLIRRDYPDHLHGSLNDEAYVQTLAKAGTVINIQESRFNHDYFNHQVLFGSNLRDYEATLCGSFVCTQYSAEIEELFEVGKEIVCYHNEHDLAEKINYYNNHPSEKENIAKAGYLRSLNSHTWEKRFYDFFEYLSL